MLTRFLLVVFALVLAVPVSADDLRTFRSRHYTIKTDMQGDGLAELVDHMDKVCSEYLQRFRSFNIRNPGPLTLYLFEDQLGYVEYLAGLRINGFGSAGMFFVRGDDRGLASWVGDRDLESVKGTLRHEGLHQVAYQRIHNNLPQWVNEGLAEYFQYSMVTSRGLEAGLSAPGALLRVQEAIESRSYIPIHDLLYVTNRDWNERVTSGEGASLQYDQAWSVVHFLVHADGGKYERLLLQFLQECGTGKNAKQATEAVFSTDLQTMERAWVSYVKSLRPDPLIIASEQMKVWAGVLAALNQKGENPDTEERLEELLRSTSLNQSLTWVPASLEDVIGDNENWWRQPLSNLRNDRPAKFRLMRDRREGMPPRVELVGLRRKFTLQWEREGDELTHEIVIR